jgi:hypothetical protein
MSPSPFDDDEGVPLQQAHHRTVDFEGTEGYGSNGIPPTPPRDSIHNKPVRRPYSEERASLFSHQAARLVLIKTQESFWQDAYNFAPGSIPHSMVLALTIGTVCGIAAYIYYVVLEWAVEYLWETLPNQVVVGHWPEQLHFLWIPLVGFTMAICLGLTVIYMGEPGDLPYTVKCVHEEGYGTYKCHAELIGCIIDLMDRSS